MIIVCGSWSPLQLPEWPLVGTRRGAFAMGVLCVGWERGFGPAVSIHVVALKRRAAFLFLVGTCIFPRDKTGLTMGKPEVNLTCMYLCMYVPKKCLTLGLCLEYETFIRA